MTDKGIGMLPALAPCVIVSVRPPARRPARLTGYAQRLDQRLFNRPGWPRILRNTLIVFIIPAGTRMAAALSYYALFAAGPTLVLTIALGRLLFGECETPQILAL